MDTQKVDSSLNSPPAPSTGASNPNSIIANKESCGVNNIQPISTLPKYHTTIPENSFKNLAKDLKNSKNSQLSSSYVVIEKPNEFSSPIGDSSQSSSRSFTPIGSSSKEEAPFFPHSNEINCYSIFGSVAQAQFDQQQITTDSLASDISINSDLTPDITYERSFFKERIIDSVIDLPKSPLIQNSDSSYFANNDYTPNNNEQAERKILFPESELDNSQLSSGTNVPEYQILSASIISDANTDINDLGSLHKEEIANHALNSPKSLLTKNTDSSYFTNNNYDSNNNEQAEAKSLFAESELDKSHLSINSDDTDVFEYQANKQSSTDTLNSLIKSSPEKRKSPDNDPKQDSALVSNIHEAKQQEPLPLSNIKTDLINIKQLIVQTIKDSDTICLANSLQNAVTTYPSLQYVSDNIFGFKLPDIHWSFMMFTHLASTTYKLAFTTGVHSAFEQELDYKIAFEQILPTIAYISKASLSHAFLKPLANQTTISDNSGMICSAQVVTQFTVDLIGDVTQHLVIGYSNPTSILYGSAFTALHCGGNDNTKLSGNIQVMSKAISFISGGLVSAYLYTHLTPNYNNFDVINNVMKIISSVAITNKFMNIIFAQLEDYYQNNIYNTNPELSISGDINTYMTE